MNIRSQNRLSRAAALYAVLVVASTLATTTASAMPGRTFSGVNGRIVYVSDGGATDYDHLVITDSFGGISTRITTAAAADTAPSFAPNGSHLAFLRETSPYRYDLFVLDLARYRQYDPPSEIRLTWGGVVRDDDGFAFEWSPDGTSIVYENWSHEIVVVRLDGAQSVLARSSTVEGARFTLSNPSWSPDGQRIAYVKLEPVGNAVNPGFSNIYVVNRDGSAPVRVTNARSHEFYSMPVWSPDGLRIAHDITFEDSGIWTSFVGVIDADGTDAVIHEMQGDDDHLLAWSAGSDRLLFEVWDRSVEPRDSTWTMRPDGTDRLKACDGESSSVFSPDGQRVLCGLWLYSGDSEHRSVALDGSDARVIGTGRNMAGSWGVAADTFQLTLSGLGAYAIDGVLITGNISRTIDWYNYRWVIVGEALMRSPSDTFVTVKVNLWLDIAGSSGWRGWIRTEEVGGVSNDVDMTDASIDIGAGTGSKTWWTYLRFCFMGRCHYFPIQNSLSFTLGDRV